MKNTSFNSLLVAGVICSTGTVFSDSHTASISIDTSAPAKQYDPMIFGGFIEHFGKQIYGGFYDPGSPLADEQGFRLDVIEAVKELKAPVIRWPGGCFVDSYHWKKGVGPNRESYNDYRWGVVEPNTFGTHEFIELCRRLDSEPYICQNSFADAQEMADWVSYCNSTTGKFAELRKANGHPEPFNVKYWSVGNERSGKKYIDHVREAAIAMKKADPNILVTCSGTHGLDARIDPYLFKTAGEYLDLLSVHAYWIENFKKHHTPDYLSCMMLSEKPDAHFNAVTKSLDRAGVRGRMTIAFDEWNLRSWHHPGFSGHHAKKVDFKDPKIISLINDREKSLDPTLYTMADALFCATFFNACFRNSEDITMANIAPLVNQTGPLYVHPEGIVKRTHFHTMSMYANLLQNRISTGVSIDSDRLNKEKESVALIDAVATVDESGKKWAVSLLNRHPSEKVACTFKFNKKKLEGVFKATLLSADSPDAFNSVDNPERVKPRKIDLHFKQGICTLPPHSLAIIEIQPLN